MIPYRRWILIFIAFAVAVAYGLPAQSSDLSQIKILIKTSATSKAHPFNVELATTPEAQAQGLMKRTAMAEDTGMLFVFDEEQERWFWMKDTYLPLDMLFIRSDGRISSIHEDAIPGDLNSIYSGGPVMAVLEVNAGTVQRLSIQPGDIVYNMDIFGNSPDP